MLVRAELKEERTEKITFSLEIQFNCTKIYVFHIFGLIKINYGINTGC